MEGIDSRTLEAIAAWAARHDEVRRVWVIGSRAGAAAREGDDLDLALELAPAPDGEETLVRWMTHADAWRSELQARVGPRIDLQWVDPDTASNEVRDAAAQGKTLAYERH